MASQLTEAGRPQSARAIDSATSASDSPAFERAIADVGRYLVAAAQRVAEGARQEVSSRIIKVSPRLTQVSSRLAKVRSRRTNVSRRRLAAAPS